MHAIRHCSSGIEHVSSKDSSPKIAELVEQIAELSLLEASELTDALKERLGITSVMMPAVGGGGGGNGSGESAETEEPATEKTHVTIKLDKFDASSKSALPSVSH